MHSTAGPASLRLGPLLLLLVLLALLWTLPAIADEPPLSASETIEGMRATCLAGCAKAGRPQEQCVQYCDCHLEIVRAGLSDEEVAELLRIAADPESKKGGMVRRWLQGSAQECRSQVFGGDASKPKKSP